MIFFLWQSTNPAEDVPENRALRVKNAVQEFRFIYNNSLIMILKG